MDYPKLIPPIVFQDAITTNVPAMLAHLKNSYGNADQLLGTDAQLAETTQFVKRGSYHASADFAQFAPSCYTALHAALLHRTLTLYNAFCTGRLAESDFFHLLAVFSVILAHGQARQDWSAPMPVKLSPIQN